MNVRERMISLSLLGLAPASVEILKEIGVTAKLRKVGKEEKQKKKKVKAK